MKKGHAIVFSCFALFAIVAAMLFMRATSRGLLSLPESLAAGNEDIRRVRVVDRHGVALSVTYQNRWNIHECIALHDVPLIFKRAFIESEDRRFYEHGGVDWLARFHALFQNALALRAVRGASTITEQVVRMLHPRPRTLWSRWLEGIEAERLEKRFSKEQILEFYLNQVPYARQRRGVVQAAHHYFDRDLATLSLREMLALVVLVRAPTGMDLRFGARSAEKGIARLAARLRDLQLITRAQYRSALVGDWSFAEPRSPIRAEHFVHYLYGNGLAMARHRGGRLASTLDGPLQEQVQRILDTRLEDLKTSGTADGAVLVLDHQTDEILAWVNGGGLSHDAPGGWIDAVIVPRQPGSTLKPFLYALAMEMGWGPATLIDDSPLAVPVGAGLHFFNNYSRTCYGPLRLRDALGNSLNIPAVRAIQFTGTKRFFNLLHVLGFHSLDKPSEHYGDGLALGDGEVSLFELVRAYAVLARHGEFRPLRTVLEDAGVRESPRKIISDEIASLIADILSDPQARQLEFGDGHLLRFPVQTAVKTGTSSDHRDAWAVGFSHRHTAGVWMGNLDRRPTDGLTGSSGPALVLRAVFAEQNRQQESYPLYLSPRLTRLFICRKSARLAGPGCPGMLEWFEPGKAPQGLCPLHREGRMEDDIKDHPSSNIREKTPRLVQPTEGLKLAMDPHIPDELEAFSFAISKRVRASKVEWIVDGKTAGTTGPNECEFLWPLSRGDHLAKARIWLPDVEEPLETPLVNFQVK